MIARGLMVAAALSVASPAGADAIARKGSDMVRLTLGACTDAAVVATLTENEQHQDAWRMALVHRHGRDQAACWRPTEGGALIVFDDGESAVIPTDAFKPAPEA